MSVLSWAAALLYWRFAKGEDRWASTVAPASPPVPGEPPGDRAR